MHAPSATAASAAGPALVLSSVGERPPGALKITSLHGPFAAPDKQRKVSAVPQKQAVPAQPVWSTHAAIAEQPSRSSQASASAAHSRQTQWAHSSVAPAWQRCSKSRVEPELPAALPPLAWCAALSPECAALPPAGLVAGSPTPPELVAIGGMAGSTGVVPPPALAPPLAEPATIVGGAGSAPQAAVAQARSASSLSSAARERTTRTRGTSA